MNVRLSKLNNPQLRNLIEEIRKDNHDLEVRIKELKLEIKDKFVMNHTVGRIEELEEDIHKICKFKNTKIEELEETIRKKDRMIIELIEMALAHIGTSIDNWHWGLKND